MLVDSQRKSGFPFPSRSLGRGGKGRAVASSQAGVWEEDKRGEKEWFPLPKPELGKEWERKRKSGLGRE